MRRLALLLAFGCSPTSPPPVADAGPSWHEALDFHGGALLSVWGTSTTDVWTVGGPRGNSGFDSLVLHFDGTAWKRLAPGGTETYWWVYGTGTNDIWMVGEKGRITHWDGAAFKEYPYPTTATLFGVWASSPTDAWVVGGTPDTPTAPNDILLHWDGTSFTPSPLPKTSGRTFYKVWGTASDNLYIVGEAGTVWHRTGTTWASENPAVAHGTLLTVFGCSATEVYVVGNRDVLRSDGKTWSSAGATLLNDVNGVSCGSPGEVVIVGSGGLKQRLTGGTWQDDFGTVPYADLHGAWADPSGAYWGVGGDFLADPSPGVSREGVVAYYGTTSIPGTLLP